MNNDIDYIVVDLDRTLIKTDLFVEAIIKLIKRNPLNVFLIFAWILRGRATAKDKIARLVNINAEFLPYEPELLDYLNEKKAQGKSLILATASHKTYANAVAEHLGIFDIVIASTSSMNLKGRNKAKAIREIVGDSDFAYAGDSVADRPIWEEAAENIFVNAPSAEIRRADSQDKLGKIIVSRGSTLAAYLKQMRPHQWAKNVLIFVPLLASHRYNQTIFVLDASVAFICFSLLASGVYFMNDLFDMEADRRHVKKRFRPLASGDLPLFFGIAGTIFLPFVAFTLAWSFLSTQFVTVLAVYFLVTNLYSFFLKQVSTADVMTLAVLYTLRIFAGAVAIDVGISSWLMAFSIFVFVSLAYLKRYIEISSLKNSSEAAHGRGYSVDDSESMFSLGVANMTASVVILSLYINNEEIVSKYNNPELLWLLCFILLYWGNRIWVGARRGKIAEDPVVFAIKDTVSRMCGLALLLVVVTAKFF